MLAGQLYKNREREREGGGGFDADGALAYITKSIAPSSFTHRVTASFRLSKLRTSMEPIPITVAPGRAVAISFAIFSVFSTFRPTIQAFAPRWTIARTW